MRAGLRYRRSICLSLVQKLGIGTSDQVRINDLCRHPRITGKPFAWITTEELERLVVKLQGVQRKGGLKPKEAMGTVLRPEVGYILVDFLPNKVGET